MKQPRPRRETTERYQHHKVGVQGQTEREALATKRRRKTREALLKQAEAKESEQKEDQDENTAREINT